MSMTKPRADTPAGERDFSRATAVATNPDAPADEREHAEAEAAKAAAPYAKQLDPQAILAFTSAIAKATDREEERMKRRIRPLSQGLSPGVAKVALTLSKEEERTVWLVRPVGIDFPRLRQIVRSDVVLKSIIWTRISQVSRFLVSSQDEWRPGFRFRYRDPNREVGDGDTDRFWWLTQWLMNCGAEFNPRRRRAMRRDNIFDFTAKHLEDSLALDAAPIEVVPTLSGRTHGWVAVDGARTYLTDPVYGLEQNEEVPELSHRFSGIHLPDVEEVIAVLTREGRIQAWFTHEDLLYPVRRPSTDSAWMGYGQPEPEDLLSIVTAFLNAVNLNARGFTHNSIPQGILTLFGDFTEEDTQQLHEEWDAWVSGVSNRWRLPVMVSKDRESGAQYTPTGIQFTEMMFGQWMTFLVSIKAALYMMDPEEINFESFTTRTSSLSGSDTEERITSSKDKGLYPLLGFYQRTLNELVQTVDDEVELYWTGLMPDQQAMKADESLAATYGEFRTKRGMNEPASEMLRDAPMNPALQGIYLQDIQAQQQEEGGEMPPESLQQPGFEDGADEDEDGNRLMSDSNGDQFQVQPSGGQEAPSQPQRPPAYEDESVLGKAASVNPDDPDDPWWY